MSKIDLTSNEWINLVFEGKNQEYGAYQFRKDSSRRHLIALIITLAITLVAFLVPVLINVVATIGDGRVVVMDATTFSDLEEAKEEEQQKPEEIPVEVIPLDLKNQIKFEIKLTEKEVTEELKTVAEVVEDTRKVGGEDIDTGKDDAPTIVEDVTKTVQAPPPPDEVYTFVSEMPEFVPGGEKGMMAFITKNVRYPAPALEGGIQGKVYVRFVISKTGKVTQVEVQRPVHSLLDKEAVRVIQSMPDWKPGRQNGVPALVAFIVPVTFKIQEQR